MDGEGEEDDEGGGVGLPIYFVHFHHCTCKKRPLEWGVSDNLLSDFSSAIFPEVRTFQNEPTGVAAGHGL